MSYFPNQGQQTAANSQSIVPASDAVQFPTGNITKKYRNNCDALPSVSEFTTTMGNGDLLFLDGNCNGASYWTISKSPWNAGTETVIDGLMTFSIPLEASFGVHRSQVSFGQDLLIEFVDDDTPAAATADLAIAALSQNTTTLTVTTAAPHNLSVGMSIGIYGCMDSRFNYPSLVINAIVNRTQFLVTAGPNGTIQSLTATPAVLGSPFVTIRRRFGGSSDGTSMAIESSTSGQASFYVRSNQGDAFASGTVNGNHSVGVGATVSTQSVNASGGYSFFPSTEFRLNLAADKVQWHDAAPDSVSVTSSRATRSSVCPNPDKSYKFRLRSINQKAMPVIVGIGGIFSSVKSGTTTATVTFINPHGLTDTDYVVIYGSRDTTNFPNLTTATKVASVVSATIITIVWGAAVTATSYGGLCARSQGGNVPNGLIAQVGVSIAYDLTYVTLVGSATFSSVLIGDTIELVGVRDATTGASYNLDGVYKVFNQATTTLTLVAISSIRGTALSTTNIGCAVIRRTDHRVSFLRVFEFLRERVEFTPRPGLDAGTALPVNAATANISQIGSTTPLMSAPQGSTSRALMVGQASAIANTDQNATAYAGVGRVNGTIVASSTGSGAVIAAEINVTALTIGTASSIVFILQESSGGTNFTDVWFSDPITATGIVRVPPILVGGRRRWAAHSVGGTSTTVTATITALELPSGYPLFRQYRDAFSATNPLSSVINSATAVATTLVNTGATCMTTTAQATAPLVVEGSRVVTMFATLANAPTVTTQPVLTLEFSNDLSNWWTSTTLITATGNGTYSASISTVAFRYARIRVTTAAVYSAGNYTISSIGINATA